MLSFVQSWFAAGSNPVGVDFGTECLRLVQVEKTGTDYRLIAAASAPIPSDVRHDSAARIEFLAAKLRELWVQGNFRGRRAVFALPAASMYVQHLRLPRMDDESIRKALPWEAQGKLPIDPSTAVLRHLVAGDVYHDQEPCSEVILLAARREAVDELLAAATSARLDVVGMNVEPRALLDCFLHIYRRKTDAEVTNCFVDIGSVASRAIIAQGGHILFARNLPVGGEHFSRAVAAEFDISLEEARAMRIRLASSTDDTPPAVEAPDDDPVSLCSSFPFFAEGGFGEEAVATLVPTAVDQSALNAADRERIERAVRPPLAKLVEELSLCRRYHESTFPNRPVKRLIFVGGEANQRDLCEQIARKLGIAAQIGDPLVRMGRTTEVGVESGIDRRLAQPAWAVALGLSMGSIGSNAT